MVENSLLEVKIFIVVFVDSSYGGRMVFLHSWKNNLFINGIPKVVWFQANFSESESFHSTIA